MMFAQIGSKSEGALEYGFDDDLEYDLAQINAQSDDSDYEFAEVAGSSESQGSSRSSSSSSSSSSSKSSSSSGSNNDAQVGADEEYGFFAQTMTAAEIEEELEDNREFFKTFLAQIGIHEGDQFLAQLDAEIDKDQLDTMLMDPNIYSGLAQLAADYYAAPPTKTEQVLSQIEATDDEAEMHQLLSQLSADELNKLSTMLEGVNDGLTLAQTERFDENELYDDYF